MIIAFKLNYNDEKQSNKNQCSTSATSNKYNIQMTVGKYVRNIPFTTPDDYYLFIGSNLHYYGGHVFFIFYSSKLGISNYYYT